ncbi:MFS transporter [Microbacterium sp. GXF0217]
MSNPSAAQLSAGVPRSRWTRIGALLLVSYLVAYIDRTNMSVAAPSMTEELGLDSGQMGILLSAFFWGYVVSLAFAGWAVAKLGAKRAIVGALFVFGLASAATGLTEDFTQLILVRVVLGLGEGLVFPAITIFFVRWFPSWERGRASGLSLLAIPISAIIMAPMSGWLISHWDYKTMFIVQGIFPILVAIIGIFLLKADPESDPRISEAERTYILENRDSDDTASKGTFRDVYFNPRVWLIGITYLLWMTGLYGFNQWLPTLLSEASGAGIQAVGWLTTIPFIFAAIGMFFASRQSDRADGKRTPFVVIPIAIAGAALLLQHLVPGGLWVEMIFLVIACVGVHAAFGPWWPWALQGVSSENTSYASSLVLSVGNFGGIIGPILVGALTRGGTVAEGGFYTLGYVLLAAAVLGAVVATWRTKVTAKAAPTTSSAVPTATK